MRDYSLFKTGILLFFLFLFLTVLIFFKRFDYLDFRLLQILQEILPRKFDFTFSLFSVFGNVEIISIFLLIPLLFLPFKSKLFILFGYAFLLFSGVFLKLFIAQAGPPLEYLRTIFFFSIPTTEVAQHFFAYPSGHMARVSFISTVIVFAIWKKGGSREVLYGFIIFLSLINFIMFFSRIYLAEHWFSDVLGGALLGSSIALLAVSSQNLTKFIKRVKV